MDKEAVRNTVKAKRLKKNVTIAEIAKTVGKNPTFVAAALNGNHRFTPDEAKKVGALLELDGPTTEALSAFPVRADYPNTTDPFKYRLLEIIGVYGDSLRDHERHRLLPRHGEGHGEPRRSALQNHAQRQVAGVQDVLMFR
jgi:cyanate lyase